MNSRNSVRKTPSRNRKTRRKVSSSQSSLDSLDEQPVFGETESLLLNLCHKANIFLETQYHRLYPLTHLHRLFATALSQDSQFLYDKAIIFFHSLMEREELSFLQKEKEKILSKEEILPALQHLIRYREKPNLKAFVSWLSCPDNFSQLKTVYLEIVSSWTVHSNLLDFKEKSSKINFVSYLLSFRSDLGFSPINTEANLIYENRSFNFLANSLSQILTELLVNNEILTLLAFSALSVLSQNKEPEFFGIKIPTDNRNINKLIWVLSSNYLDTRYGWEKLYSAWGSLYRLILDSLGMEVPFF